jgi:hypothetical protein
VNSFGRYVLAVMWGVISEVCAEQLKRFVHGFWVNEFHPLPEAAAVIGFYCLILVGAIWFAAYSTEHFFTGRGQKIVLFASLIATGIVYPSRC